MRVLSFDVGVKNLSFCYGELDTEEVQIPKVDDEPAKKKRKKTHENRLLTLVAITDWRVVNIEQYLSRKQSKKSITIEENVQCLVRALETTFPPAFFTCPPDAVVIEQQPAGNSFVRNSRMKIISHVIQAFFVMKCVPIVTFVSPKKKNSLYIDTEEKKKYTYAENKRKSIEACTHYLKNCAQDWQGLFQSHKKKDDLADSFLQMLVFGIQHLKCYRFNAN